MKIAIVGTGISGLTAARMLHPDHEITVFEAAPRLGGHTHTVDVVVGDRVVPVDTGFIVYNERTYPHFTRLLNDLGVATQASTMSFGVKCERTGLEYNGTSLNGLFAQRRNLLRPRFYRMIRDILRFNEAGKAMVAAGEIPEDLTLGTYLAGEDYGEMFVDSYILPMGAAIWSAGRERMLAFPLRFFLRFFDNHGMLNIDDRPVWRVVRGGSRSYLDPLTAPFADRIRLSSPVHGILRTSDGVRLKVRNGPIEYFDEVVLAVHADQALRLLEDPSQDERRILGALPYQENHVLLHTDTSILPRRRLAWAAWNYHIPRDRQDRVAVTYNMNLLQGLDLPKTFCVTLNYGEAVDPFKVVTELTYHHPIFTLEGERAKARFDSISGRRHTHFCGAYWFNGFHEDGVRSGLRVAEAIRATSERLAAVPV
ncbi:FAD-dependent oxidoreductase [Sulfidibacter corallicola]|uniref:FAD-dependent oxidoreductase n=1 Tax=Sulfidibacter corallicola TaxID=2818388 RepID=A0A8A4TNJ8_SULCO|nr:FAD-dependent oxidoreductase [Sulfidibacter corallicola]QTD48165.1 FAD-dependent oxidoreductase [Sulfidibacter corallicola]